MKKDYQLITASLGWGASIAEAELGPDAFLESQLYCDSYISSLLNTDITKLKPSKSVKDTTLPLGKERLSLVADFNQELAKEVEASLKASKFPIVLGGDHSIAIGTWFGAKNALPENEDMGLIWIDAHMDSHTPETSVSKAYHGMPVAVLMGYGESDLTNINRYKASIKPENIVQIGIRSFEGGEARLLHSLGAKIFTMDDVRSLGLKETLEIAVDYLKRRVKHFGLSIDLDAFDPEDSPGTGTPVANGIKFDEFYQNLDLLYNDSGIIGLEIVEFNPLRDQGNKTLNIIMKLVEKLIKEESYAVFARKSSNINKW